MAITISILNRKGGSGKTTTTTSLSGWWSRLGLRVLAIDLDPQADLTSGLSLDDPEQLPIEATAAALFQDRYISADRLIAPTPFPNLWLLPASELLRPVSGLSAEDYAGRQLAVRAFVEDVADRFDRVVIDNPPVLGFCAWASLAAANFALTPVQANAKGWKGLRPVNQFVADVQRQVNPDLAQLGYVRTVFEARKSVHLAYSLRMSRDFPGLLFEEYFPKAAQFEDADTARKPITHYKPNCAASKAVGRIAEEIDQRIKRSRPATVEAA